MREFASDGGAACATSFTSRLSRRAISVAEKDLSIRYVPGPLGVRGRNSHNALIREKLGWAPSGTLLDGLKQTYPWIAHQVNLVGGTQCTILLPSSST